MELSKNFEPGSIEEKWTLHWKSKRYFNSTPDDRKAFTVVIPPPNVTGVLHMGHTLNETVQDILVRKARMSGYNACWVPGSDHASIATEAKVVQWLKQQGIEKAGPHGGRTVGDMQITYQKAGDEIFVTEVKQWQPDSEAGEYDSFKINVPPGAKAVDSYQP